MQVPPDVLPMHFAQEDTGEALPEQGGTAGRPWTQEAE